MVARNATPELSEKTFRVRDPPGRTFALGIIWREFQRLSPILSRLFQTGDGGLRLQKTDVCSSEIECDERRRFQRRDTSVVCFNFGQQFFEYRNCFPVLT